MELRIYTEPTIEPVSVQEMKEHLRLDSGAFADNLTVSIMIAPGSQSLTAGYSLVGSYITVLGLSAVVSLTSGTVGAGGSVDCKIQESDDHITWIDWQSFTVVTPANDNATQQVAYTGTKTYIRVVAMVLVATASFGVSCLVYASDATEDEILASAIIAARAQVEAITKRALITQTWDMVLDSFPGSCSASRWTRTSSEIIVPLGVLQDIDSFSYKDSEGVVTSLTVTDDYLVDTFSIPGRLVLPPGVSSWPSSFLYPLNPITIRFVCGYGDTSSTVPAGLRAAIKMMVADLYRNRDAQEIPTAGRGISFIENRTVANLIEPYRIRGGW